MERILIVSSIILWIFVVFNFLLTLMLIRNFNQITNEGSSTSKNQGPPVGQKAPSFVAKTLAGDQVSLDTLHGQSTVLIAFGPGCSFCIESLDEYHDLASKAKRKGFEFYLVSDSETSITHSFCIEYKIKLPVIVAPISSNRFLRDYNFQSVPGYCLFDENGFVISSGYPNLALDSEWRKLANSWQD